MKASIYFYSMDTERSLYEIEVALAKSDEFNFVRNIVAFNVNGWGNNPYIGHECDMLILSKSGYLTEIEIKRSLSDFLADFKKKHYHESEIIKYFYYCVPESIYDKVCDELSKRCVSYSGIITFDEDLNIRNLGYDKNGHVREIYPNRKLFLEEQLQVARFGAMRSVLLKEKIIKLEKS